MTSVLPVILRTADLRAAHLDDRELRRRRAHGDLVRVAPGCFVSAQAWAELDRHTRYRLRVVARMPRLSTDVVASHDSAAVLWGMPCLDRWPSMIHVIDTGRIRPLSRGSLVRHTALLLDGDVVSGETFSATSPVRTAVDLALRDGFVTGLLLFDHGLRTGLFTSDELDAAIAVRHDARRIRAASSASERASALSESPWESISRAQMILLGFDEPELQRKFFTDGVEVARTDFWWDGVGIAGEFDGATRSTRTPSCEAVAARNRW